MATINYIVRGKKKLVNIKIRFKRGDKFDCELSTGLKINPNHWNKDKQVVKKVADATNKDLVNRHLALLKVYIKEEYDKISASNPNITQQWLRDRLDEYFERTPQKTNDTRIYLVSFIEEFIKESEARRNRKQVKTISESTIDAYRGTRNKILLFEKYIKKKIKLSEIDLEFHEQFISFLEEEEQLSNNTIGFYIGKIQATCRRALEKGCKVSLAFQSRDFYAPSNEVLDTYLKEEEIDKIFNLEFPLGSKLDNSRDWLIVGVWTGLRVSDLLKLTSNNLDNGLISVISQKTGIPVLIPIHPQVDSILSKYNFQFPRPISEQKFNDYAKEVCKAAEINKLTEGYKISPIKRGKETIYRKKKGKYPKYELISSHVCRRSFATNLYGNMDTLTIMKITGHKTESSFLTYIKTTPKEHALKLKEFWAKQKE